MKKIISLLLALIMAFSVVTVAFATGEGADAETTAAAPADGETTDDPADGEEAEDPEAEPEQDFGDLQWIMDLPFWTAKSGLKIAKIAFKLVSVYLTIAKIFGLVEEDMDDILLNAILDLIESTQNGEEVPEESTTAPEETTAPAAA